MVSEVPRKTVSNFVLVRFSKNPYLELSQIIFIYFPWEKNKGCTQFSHDWA